MDASKNIEDILSQNGMYVSTTSGTSMWPMLRHRRDNVVIRVTTSRLKKHDVALYRMPDGKLLLHRIIKVLPYGYVGRGDNRTVTERFSDSQVVGVLDSFYRNDKKYSGNFKTYLPYIVLSRVLYPVRRVLNFGRRYFKNGYRKAFKCILINKKGS